jgi:uncharacterized membrane protein
LQIVMREGLQPMNGNWQNHPLERTMRRTIQGIAGATFALLLLTPAVAQQAANSPSGLTGFWLTTPYPRLAIQPGETEAISLTLRNDRLPPQRADLEVTGVPSDWKWTLKGGGNQVYAAIVGPDSTERLTLELTPPAKAAMGERHAVEVKARTADNTISLPLEVQVAREETASAGLKLESELPALRGTARSTFSFKIEVTNEGTEEGLFNLAAQLPEGFRARFKKGYGSEEITGLPIAADASETVTLEVAPSRDTPAGRYPLTFQVSGGNQTASTELSVEVTGEPQVQIVGPQERLSGEATAGRESTFTFTLVNSGSASAADLELSATSPSGWKVEFEPKQIADLAPGASNPVAVKITPSERAVAGDYMVGLRAAGGPVSQDVQFRTTVRTSTVWGIAGLGVIGVAVLVLAGAVMRYGRR